MAVPVTMKLPCPETRVLNDVGHRMQCIAPANHHGSHSVFYGGVGFAWESNGKAQCPIRHGANGVRCLAHEGHGAKHQGVSLHGGEIVSWTRVVKPGESDLGKPQITPVPQPPKSQAYVDSLMKRVREGYVTPATYDHFDSFATLKKLADPNPLDLKGWVFDEMVARSILEQKTFTLSDGAPAQEHTLDPDTGLTAHDAVPEPGPRSYSERKARRARRSQ